MDVSWPYAVSAMASIMTLPLYVLIVIAGLADIWSLVNYLLFTFLRESQLFNVFFWENRHFIAKYEHTNICFSTFLRFVGITLMSLQRYIGVCQSGGRIEWVFVQIRFRLVSLVFSSNNI
ncbi:hypothetical protein COOONC_08648 [Cooperia oncophora]